MAIQDTLRKVVSLVAPEPQKSADGRDQWPSRAAFLLAAMGGCAGQGNLLRYPSQVYNNSGLQWFVPYLIAVTVIAIPILMLEIAIGQAYRGGCVVAYNNASFRLRGVGLGMLYVGFVVAPYFVANLSWIMIYFRNSFYSPLPWAGDTDNFYNKTVIANPDPKLGFLNDDGSVAAYTSYPGVDLIGETVGWSVFVWFLVWVSIFRGVGLTGRVVYFTMGLPIVVTLILVGRSLSLPGASRGVELFWATWNSEKLASGEIWQTACGQVFFSTGVGFGYFTSYASYNQKHSNAVVDSIAIVASNVMFENVAAFAVYGVVGFLELWPEDGVRLGAFSVGFLTLPQAVAEMPVPNLWAILLFFTLVVLGYSSAFAMVDALVTLVMDAHPKFSRPWVVTAIVTIFFLLTLPYCTGFGYYLLTGIDRWINDIALVFVVWAEAACSTTVYRWRDAQRQIGLPAWIAYNTGYLGGMVFGVAVAHAVSPAAGCGMGFGLYVAGIALTIILGKTPDVRAPGFWGSNVFLSRFWFAAFYSGNQLARDLNEIVGQGKNWRLPVFWAPMIRYLAAPILAIVYGFSYPAFYQLRFDPLHILGFFVGHVLLIIIAAGFIVPRWFDPLVPPARRDDGKYDLPALVNANIAGPGETASLEEGSDSGKDGKDKVAGESPVIDDVDVSNTETPRVDVK